MNSCLLFS